MTRVSVNHVVIMIPVLLLMAETPCMAQSRLQRFCERYPYAKRCLGVAAKRSPSKFDFYSALINRVLEETMKEKLFRETINKAKNNAVEDTNEKIDVLEDDTSKAIERLPLFLRDHRHTDKDSFKVPMYEWSTANIFNVHDRTNDLQRIKYV